jgi:endogenous inhibitor of DNA gyrase (YacG/DUF329 family)
VTCPQCGHKFTHSEIQPDIIEKSRRDPFGIVPKPAIPRAGDKRSCPNCKTESVFQPVHLSYEIR